METARLLLLSGRANSSGLVGSNLFFSTLRSGWGRFPASAPEFPPGARGMPFLDRAVQDFYTRKPSDLRTSHSAHPKAGTLLFDRPHINPIYQAERLAKTADGRRAFGRELTRRLREFFVESNTIEWTAMGEFFPHTGARVTLDPKVKDRFGLPVARFSADVHPLASAALEDLREKAESILDAAGALRQGVYAEPDQVSMVIQGGTARMGKSPKHSVCDATCQTHDHPNLYLADSSTFPSSGGAPFTLTIMANALRVADAIANRARTGQL
jgi:choline dehydrogenase-like flavoprotein